MTLGSDVPPPLAHLSKPVLKIWHDELHIPPTLVQEMAQHGAGHYIGARGPAGPDRRAYRINTTIFLQLL